MRILPLLAMIWMNAVLALAQTGSATRNLGAPCPPLTTTCTWKSGKPCSKWLSKVVGQFPPLTESEKRVQRAGSAPCTQKPDQADFWYVIAMTWRQRRAIAAGVRGLSADNAPVPDPTNGISAREHGGTDGPAAPR